MKKCFQRLITHCTVNGAEMSAIKPFHHGWLTALFYLCEDRIELWLNNMLIYNHFTLYVSNRNESYGESMYMRKDSTITLRFIVESDIIRLFYCITYHKVSNRTSELCVSGEFLGASGFPRGPLSRLYSLIVLNIRYYIYIVLYIYYNFLKWASLNQINWH